jgi:N-acetylglucosaminyldiphosphoundecaprenol N-acetyl-beta-D-mannosaminyltransferase
VSAPRSVVLGSLRIDSVTSDEALAAVESLVRAGRGGAVFTPNVDHVMIASEDQGLRAAYARVDLSIPDGMPIVWAARLLGTPIPERVAGSDFVPLVLEQAASRGWRVYFLGGAPGAAERARDRLRQSLPDLNVVGLDAPRFDPHAPWSVQAGVVGRIREAKPDIVLVGFGAPKQERWIDQARDELPPMVFFGVGATIDFLAGDLPRAPRWMARSGLEWLYRLSREPKRLWHRYLVRDPKFVIVLARALKRRVQAS